MTALVGGQCLGLALPSVATVNSGRGAAYGVYAMIDRVSDSFQFLLIILFFNSKEFEWTGPM